MGAEGAKMSSEFQKRPYLSGQWTEQNNNDSIAIRAADKPEYQTIILRLFIYLGNFENERGNHHVGNIECN